MKKIHKKRDFEYTRLNRTILFRVLIAENENKGAAHITEIKMFDRLWRVREWRKAAAPAHGFVGGLMNKYLRIEAQWRKRESRVGLHVGNKSSS